MRKPTLKIVLAAFAIAVPLPSVAQTNDSLSLDRIWNSAEFSGDRFGPARWLSDSTYTTLERASGQEVGTDVVRYDAHGGSREIMVAADRLVPSGSSRPLRVDDYAWSPDGRLLLVFTNSKRVWRTNTRGDYWVLKRETGELFQLGGDVPESTLMFAKFSSDGSRVAFVQQNNIYVQDLASRRITAVTHDGSRTIINGTFDWVYEEELGLQDGFRWSPDGQSIAYWQLDASGVRDFLLINDTDSLYSFVTPVQYPKAGETNSAARAGVVPAGGGETVWFGLDGDPRNNYIARMDWAAGSEEVVLQYLNRRQDTNRVILADVMTGQVRTVLTETDEAWVDIRDDFHWLRDGRSFTWVSERDGWRRAYRASRDDGSLTPLTPPKTDIMRIALVDEESGWLYYIASPDNPTQLYLYRVPLSADPGAAERLSPADMPGTHAYQMAPGGHFAFHTYSTFDDPPTISLVALPQHDEVRTLVANTALRDRVRSARTSTTEFFRVDIGEGVVLDGWMMKPAGFDRTKKYPVLVYVYGEPAAQTVVDRWGGRRTMWHDYLTQHGYIVLSLESRGTPQPRGRDWRKIVYGEIGTLASHDQAFGVQALLATRPYLDGERVGVWGWSGGGSQTLNAMFRYPKIFQTGMAVAPVPDQRYYDTIYQERYMGRPQDNPAGYRLGSPITYAAQLEGNLLIVHGTGDDNVHYQGTEALINKLIEYNKHFTMMAYPNRTHGIFEGKGTTRHLYGLLTRYLEEHLPAGAQEQNETSDRM